LGKIFFSIKKQKLGEKNENFRFFQNFKKTIRPKKIETLEIGRISGISMKPEHTTNWMLIYLILF
jgi:hypothetical protein